MNLVPFVFFLVLMTIAAAVGIIAIFRRRSPGAVGLVVLSAALLVWSAAYLIHLRYPSSGSERLGVALVYLSMTVAASAYFAFSLSYTNRSAWISPLATLLLAFMPVLTQVLYWLRPAADFFFADAGPHPASTLPLVGLWARVDAVYVYTLVGSGLLILVGAFSRKPRSLFFSSWPIPILFSALLFVVEMLNVVGLRSIVPIDPSLFSFSLAGIGFAYGLFKQSLIESLPASREAVVEGMNDGWMVVNAGEVIVDLNPATERMIGLPREKVYGQKLHSVLPDLPRLTPGSEGVQELEMKRSFRSHEGWRFLNIRISTLADEKRQQFGHLIVWRDITERRMAEDARQRARDEMFVLLNAISSEASQALNLEDFLSESIYQIIYPFRSQMVAIFVAEEKKQEETAERDFRLLAHFGLPADAADITPPLPASSPLFNPVDRNHAPRLIEDPSAEQDLPAVLLDTECACLLAIPLVTQDGDENRVIGCMFLGRKEKPFFSQDESVRLGTIGDHLANLINSERRRKLAISLSERQRLLRDLHDSVSQKLYGLVYMTEAAQAALEAGTTVDPAQILSRIGDNARQAVREMRLFLFQMQTIDVEKEGLIAPLQYRLSAVEGRADTKARLLADENISLSMEKQVALYYIAQEALNNALRHAAAKNVLVRVKQGRRNVILEIQDDGCGFDPRHVDGGGLGLANMRERASKIRGTLRIQSRPEQGTRVIVTVPRDQPVTQPRRRR